MRNPMDDSSMDFLEEQKRKMVKQGEEMMEDSLSEKKSEPAQDELVKKPDSRLKTAPDELVEDPVIAAKAKTIEEKREKVKSLKAKSQALKKRHAKERAKPIVTDEKSAGQISYLRSGGLTQIEVSRLMNWMASWSESNKENLYKRLRATKDEDQLESVLKRLSIEATLRGF